MAATIPNIAKGRINEYVNRVDSDDPTNAVLVLMLLQGPVVSTLDQFRDFDTFQAILAVETECNATNYARIILDQADVSPPTVDDAGNQQTWDIADQTFTALGNGTNNDIGAAVLGYDPDSTGGTDANIIPIWVTLPAADVTTNGQDFHVVFNASGVWTAEEP